MTQDLRYPIGRFRIDAESTPEKRAGWIRQLAEAPALVREAVERLSDDQLERTYRPDGWTIRQLVHHLADSHSNASTRIRLALTEDNPTIKTYKEAAWASLADASQGPIQPSLQVLDGIHTRLVSLLRNLEPGQFQARLIHPEVGPLTVDSLLQLYAWHSRHHLAHIRKALAD